MPFIPAIVIALSYAFIIYIVVNFNNWENPR